MKKFKATDTRIHSLLYYVVGYLGCFLTALLPTLFIEEIGNDLFQQDEHNQISWIVLFGARGMLPLIWMGIVDYQGRYSKTLVLYGNLLCSLCIAGLNVIPPNGEYGAILAFVAFVWGINILCHTQFPFILYEHRRTVGEESREDTAIINSVGLLAGLISTFLVFFIRKEDMVWREAFLWLAYLNLAIFILRAYLYTHLPAVHTPSEKKLGFSIKNLSFSKEEIPIWLETFKVYSAYSFIIWMRSYTIRENLFSPLLLEQAVLIRSLLSIPIRGILAKAIDIKEASKYTNIALRISVLCIVLPVVLFDLNDDKSVILMYIIQILPLSLMGLYAFESFNNRIGALDLSAQEKSRKWHLYKFINTCLWSVLPNFVVYNLGLGLGSLIILMSVLLFLTI